MSSKPFLYILISLSVLFSSIASAQSNALSMDPADIFFAGWQTITSAEKLEKNGQYSESLQKYRQAAKYFDSLSRFHQTWKTSMVDNRIKTTQLSIENIEPKVIAELAQEKQQNGDLIEGGITDEDLGSTSPLGTDHSFKTPPTLSPDKLPAENSSNDKVLQHRMRMLEDQNSELKKQLAEVQKQLQTDSKLSSRSTEQKLKQTIKSKEQEIAQLRNILARSPIQADMDRLTSLNKVREIEIATLADAYKNSERKLEASRKIAEQKSLEALEAQKRIEELAENMELQQNQNNLVIDKLRNELKGLSSLLEKTRQELGASRAEQEALQVQLSQSQSMITELTEERDNLRTERDTLSNLLNQNDSQGVQKLIAENMRLGTELKQTTDRFDYLVSSNNATKDELLEAKSDLAIAKTRIMKYQNDQEDYMMRMKTMEEQLREAKAQLANAESPTGQNTDPEELKILRSTVKRLITAQERRQLAETILWETYQGSQQSIQGMAEAFQDLRQTKVELSDEEKVLLATRSPDQQFQSPQRVPLQHALAHGNALEKELQIYKPIVSRAFKQGKFEGARQILADMDERFPGNLYVLCSRGIVELKTRNYSAATDLFNEAITMNEENYYAHYMLGVTEYKKRDLEEARKSFERSLQIKPTHARTHIFLGSIAGDQHRYEKAEEHFLSATKLEPTNADAYYNLSALYTYKKRKYEALDFYQKALQNGKTPDVVHQRRLDNLTN
ncbi:MAG: tetratricopeptide repeat protein [Akkermansiaceae bacterium]